MFAQRQLKGIPAATEPVFSPAELAHAEAIQRAYDRIGHMYWGDRITLTDACSRLRRWITANLVCARRGLP
jgi:hypothetical protein